MDLIYFEKWVRKEFNIDLSAYKSNQLHRRINSLMDRVNVSSVDEYIKLLKSDPSQKKKFLDFITINVTEFFRNPDIFKEFEELLRKYMLKENKSIKVWSAACSIGAEPYTIAMILKEMPYKFRHEILATDIDDTILLRGKKGVYTKDEVKGIKPDILSKYFINKEDKFIISDALKSMVTFKKHDLILGAYEKEFDVIVCRNVVIYFNQEVKDRIYKKFSESLKSGGLLFVGATESIYNYREFGFEKASTFIYRKL
ncbi:CheR family methyltransferase [Hathewaya histolytica]|uniref:CheR family methyltransferase n=1 Tax=Hathewaya histolytica TaxID=1498 RepID=UPI003B682605